MAFLNIYNNIHESWSRWKLQFPRLNDECIQILIEVLKCLFSKLEYDQLVLINQCFYFPSNSQAKRSSLFLITLFEILQFHLIGLFLPWDWQRLRLLQAELLAATRADRTSTLNALAFIMLLPLPLFLIHYG